LPFVFLQRLVKMFCDFSFVILNKSSSCFHGSVKAALHWIICETQGV